MLLVETRKPAAGRVTLCGGYESRVVLGLCALLFLALAFMMPFDTGQAGLAGTLVLALLIGLFSLAMLWFTLRSSVVVEDDVVLIRHFADPRSRRLPRADVVGVELVEAGSLAMSALVPRLRMSTDFGQSLDPANAELTPLVVWTWWRSGTPRRMERIVERLNTALELDGGQHG